MTRVFVDTSAIYALIVQSDLNHHAALSAFSSLRAEDASLVTSSAVIQESIALLQRRFGLESVRRFCEKLLPGLEVVYVDQDLLQQSLYALFAAARREVSLTDWVGITIMRKQGIHTAFAFDKHYSEQGFDFPA